MRSGSAVHQVGNGVSSAWKKLRSLCPSRSQNALRNRTLTFTTGPITKPSRISDRVGNSGVNVMPVSAGCWRTPSGSAITQRDAVKRRSRPACVAITSTWPLRQRTSRMNVLSSIRDGSWTLRASASANWS